MKSGDDLVKWSFAIQDLLVWLSKRHGEIGRDRWNNVSFGIAPDYDTTFDSIRFNLNRAATTPDHRPTEADLAATENDSAVITGWCSGIESALGAKPPKRKVFAPPKLPMKAFWDSLGNDWEYWIKVGLAVLAGAIVLHGLITRKWSRS